MNDINRCTYCDCMSGAGFHNSVECTPTRNCKFFAGFVVHCHGKAQKPFQPRPRACFFKKSAVQRKVLVLAMDCTWPCMGMLVAVTWQCVFARAMVAAPAGMPAARQIYTTPTPIPRARTAPVCGWYACICAGGRPAMASSICMRSSQGRAAT